MYFRLLGKLPDRITVALSGGVDSIAILYFLLQSKKNVDACFFDHGNELAIKEKSFVTEWCDKHGVNLVVGSSTTEKGKGLSLEEYWRIERYKFLHSFDNPVVTGHNLDDAVESWIFNSLHGKGYTIPYQNKNVIRPFLLCEKDSFYTYCFDKNVEFFEDSTNQDLKFSRNRIRHKIVPEALKINPGLKKVVRKIIITKLTEKENEQNSID